MELTFLLGMGFQLLLAEFVRRVEAAGYPDLRPMHGYVFQAVQHGGATGTELAAALGVTKQAAGHLVDELVGKGYLRREPHPAGGRRRLVVLTERGREHLVTAGRIMRELEREVEAQVGAQELTRLREALTTLIARRSGGNPPPLRPFW
ncbi:MarR family winged helix-turn-helix transcriptional regulator [Rhizomonospora bruguierae]|uniref:MarR family winged helix-turn-helix transcriptional regulator n=1 Tax=Rhizomonospora bruguierae TaxID=1581705 RepID=UPI0020BE8F90|nr:MarR family transcriptional regulator [Micromonospora sp. NBRC 107566]